MSRRQVSKRRGRLSAEAHKLLDLETRFTLREHFKRNGAPKRRFRSEKHAKTFLKDTRQDATMHAYRCNFCDGWHIATNHEGGAT